MKAAVVYKNGDLPEYTDHAEPIINDEDEIILNVKAVAVKHIDKSRASGKHYSANEKREGGSVPGSDGVGLLEDGTRVYAAGADGMMAERAVIDKRRIVPVPQGLDDITAAALPNAVIGSAMALKYKADMQPGDVVLINGATGVTGKVAVQIAKQYGAKKVIATGRNEQALEALKELGADETILLKDNDAELLNKIKAIHQHSPINVIIDYLWGPSAEVLLGALKGDGRFTPKTRFVSVGAMAGDVIQLSAANLRSVDLQLSGSGMGSWAKWQVQQFFTEMMPEMFQLAVEGKLKIDTVTIDLKNIASVWDMPIASGSRVVVTI